MLIFRFIPAPQGVGPGGMPVVGVFVGVLLLWLTIGIDWPSLLCLLALALCPGLKIGTILSGSIGNQTFAFLLFTFMCTHALSETPFIRRCAGWFIGSALARKSAWGFVTLFFASVLFLGSFISPTVLFVIYLPILDEICAMLSLKKGGKPGQMLMMGLVFCCGISSGMTPIAHVFPIMAIGYWQAAGGAAISWASYMAFAVPCGLILFGVMMLVFRFILRPDMSQLTQNTRIELELRRMDAREKPILAVFAVVAAMWVVPGLISGVAPGVSAAFDALGSAFPPLLGCVLMSVITSGGKPLLDFKSAMQNGVPWGSLIMCASTLALGAALTNADIGLTAWLSAAAAPRIQTLAPLALVLVFALWAAVQTNLSSNMVTVTVVTAVAIPICTAAPGVSAPAVCAIIGMLASCAFATPPAMPCVAIAGASGWTDSRSLLGYGSLMGFACTAVCGTLGYAIASALM